MKLKLSRPLAAAAFAVLAATGSTVQARDNVYWNIGIDAAPGVTLGVGNTRPVVVAPAPVIVQPQPVYVARPVVVHPAPVIVRPAPVYYETVVVHPGRHKGWRKKHHRHHHHGDD